MSLELHTVAVGDRVSVTYRPPTDRRRKLHTRGIVHAVGPHAVTIARTVVDPDVPGRAPAGERVVLVTVRLADVVTIEVRP